jgi:hypothetical protein
MLYHLLYFVVSSQLCICLLLILVVPSSIHNIIYCCLNLFLTEYFYSICTQAAYAEKIVDGWETVAEETSGYGRRSDNMTS